MGRRITIRGVVEVEENEKSMPVEQARQMRLESFASIKGFGVPELIVLTKTLRSASISTALSQSSSASAANDNGDASANSQTTMNQKQTHAEDDRYIVRSHYHFVLGFDASSGACISTYLAELLNAGLEVCTHGVWNPLHLGCDHHWTVQAATFRCYLPLSRRDLVANAVVPGDVKFYTVDADGNESSQVSSREWSEAYVGALLRLWCSTGISPPYPALRVNVSSPILNNYKAEQRFLNSALELVDTWNMSGSDWDPQSLTVPSAASSRVASTIAGYLLNHSRFSTLVNLFSSFSDSQWPQNRKDYLERHPDLSLYAARARIALLHDAELIEKEFAFVKTHLDSNSEKVNESLVFTRMALLATERASYLASSTCGRWKEARLELQKVGEMKLPGHADGWTLFEVGAKAAEIELDASQNGSVPQPEAVRNALLFLNRIDIPAPVLDTFLRDVFPGRRRLTDPEFGAHDGSDLERIAAERQRTERSSKTSAQASRRRPDRGLDQLASRLLSSEECRVFSILVRMWKMVGWDELMKIRSESFVMETDPVDTEYENGLSSSDDEPQSFNGKLICKPWLDFLVSTLFEDINCYSTWQAEREQLSNAVVQEQHGQSNEADSTAGSAAIPVSEKPEKQSSHDHAKEDGLSMRSAHEKQPSEESAAGASGDSPGEAAVNEALQTTLRSSRPSVDWLRRAELATRLGNFEDAKLAWRICSKVSNEFENSQSLCAYLGLMRIYSEEPSSAGLLLNVCRLAWLLIVMESGWTPVSVSRSASHPVKEIEFPSLDDFPSQADTSVGGNETEKEVSSWPPPTAAIRCAVYNSIHSSGLKTFKLHLDLIVWREFELPLKKAFLDLVCQASEFGVDGIDR